MRTMKLVCLVAGLLLVGTPALGGQVWVADNFRNVTPLAGVAYTVTPAAGETFLQIDLGLDRACRDGLGHSAFFDNVVVMDDMGTPVWADGFEAGLGNWTTSNPSGDATTTFATLATYTSSQGTAVPTEGSMMAQVYKQNGGLAMMESVAIPVVAGTQYQISVAVGGLGEWDNCGFRWNKYGYNLTPEPSALILLALGGLALLRRR